jgi:hypothetical protein
LICTVGTELSRTDSRQYPWKRPYELNRNPSIRVIIRFSSNRSNYPHARNNGNNITEQSNQFACKLTQHSLQSTPIIGRKIGWKIGIERRRWFGWTRRWLPSWAPRAWLLRWASGARLCCCRLLSGIASCGFDYRCWLLGGASRDGLCRRWFLSWTTCYGRGGGGNRKTTVGPGCDVRVHNCIYSPRLVADAWNY